MRSSIEWQRNLQTNKRREYLYTLTASELQQQLKFLHFTDSIMIGVGTKDEKFIFSPSLSIHHYYTEDVQTKRWSAFDEKFHSIWTTTWSRLVCCCINRIRIWGCFANHFEGFPSLQGLGFGPSCRSDHVVIFPGYITRGFPSWPTPCWSFEARGLEKLAIWSAAFLIASSNLVCWTQRVHIIPLDYYTLFREQGQTKKRLFLSDSTSAALLSTPFMELLP